MTRLVSLLPLFLLACTTAAELDNPDRRPLGKADAFGTCADSDCDGQSLDGNCWCDDACVQFGDCCADRVEVCEAPDTKTCGGFAGLSCGEGEYCDMAAGDGCFVDDGAGVCRPIPEACIEVFAPVCGCDGVTYGNSCDAAANGASVLHEGECEPKPEKKACGGFMGLTCGDDEFCSYAPSDTCGFADALGTCEPRPEACIQVFDPVCGCDGQTYSNACHANVAGVSVASAGECN